MNNMNNTTPIIHVDTNNNEFIKEIQECMFSLKNLTKFTSHQLDYEEITKNNKIGFSNQKENKNQKDKENSKQNSKQVADYIIPCEKDKLFWCFYIIKMGIDKYNMLDISNQHFTIEKEMKFKFIEIQRQNKSLLKNNKIKPLSEVEDDLANKECITLKTFLSLCILEQKNIIILHKRKMFEYMFDSNEPIQIITKIDEKKYSLDLQVTKEKIENYRTNYYHWLHVDSILKSMTSYKLEELYEICEKLGIDYNNNNNNDINQSKKKKSKKEIYELIIHNF